MPPFGILANHKIKMCHYSMKKNNDTKDYSEQLEFLNSQPYYASKKLLSSRQIFRYAVPASTVTKKSTAYRWSCHPWCPGFLGVSKFKYATGIFKEENGLAVATKFRQNKAKLNTLVLCKKSGNFCMNSRVFGFVEFKYDIWYEIIALATLAVLQNYGHFA